MKFFNAFALLVAATAAIPVEPKDATIQRYENNIGVGGYDFIVQTSNGITQQEQAQLKNVGTENETIEVRGQFSYTGPDGVPYSVSYTADENGFQPLG